MGIDRVWGTVGGYISAAMYKLSHQWIYMEPKHGKYRIAGNFRMVQIFAYFECSLRIRT